MALFAALLTALPIILNLTTAESYKLALGAAVLAYLLPQHPLRAIYFSVLSGGLSWLAVLASARLFRLLRG